MEEDRNEWPDFSVVVTDNQTHGRGRNDRMWSCPAGKALALSVLLRPRSKTFGDELGWLPLLAGVAMAKTVQKALVGAEVAVKWPNDVLVGEKKICGILSTVLPDGSGVIIGTGINLTLEAEDLPVPTATSLTLLGAQEISVDTILAHYLRELKALYHFWSDSRITGDYRTLVRIVSEHCGTLNRQIRVELPNGTISTGIATALDAWGRLEFTAADGSRQHLSTGDIQHIRHR